MPTQVNLGIPQQQMHSMAGMAQGPSAVAVGAGGLEGEYGNRFSRVSLEDEDKVAAPAPESIIIVVVIVVIIIIISRPRICPGMPVSALKPCSPSDGTSDHVTVEDTILCLWCEAHCVIIMGDMNAQALHAAIEASLQGSLPALPPAAAANSDNGRAHAATMNEAGASGEEVEEAPNHRQEEGSSASNIPAEELLKIHFGYQMFKSFVSLTSTPSSAKLPREQIPAQAPHQPFSSPPRSDGAPPNPSPHDCHCRL